jgi:predicted permease
VIARRLDEQSPAPERDQGISVMPLSVYVTGPRERLALWMLSVAVFCVLLIAATNIAGLSLARGANREAEMAVRAALGASRGRIITQLLAESLTLAAIAGAAGLLIAWGAVRLILFTVPANLARLNDASLDFRVVGWALGLCLITGVLVGLAPAITVARRNIKPSEGRSVTSGFAARNIRRALVMAEFALAIVLLAGAGLLIRSLWSLEKVDSGLNPARVLSAQLSTALVGAPQRVDFYRRALEQVASLPGVESAGIIGDLFIGGNPERTVTTEDATSERIRLRTDEVSDQLFTTLGIPLLKGRFFSSEDGPNSPRVAIINNTMARRLWPGRDPLGRQFKFGSRESDAPWVSVVGVVGDVRRQGLESEPIPQMFEPLAQNPSRLATLLVRTSMEDPLKIVAAVQTAVREADSRAPVYGVSTLENRLGGFLSLRRFQTWLLIAFAAIALLMAAIGIYGLIQYSVATRTNEIGIRMAIGAQRGEIFRMILREGLKLSVTGAALGIAGAFAMGSAASSLLFGVTPSDPLTFSTVSLLLILVAAAACYFPARRAMKTDPIVALRHD